MTSDSERPCGVLDEGCELWNKAADDIRHFLQRFGKRLNRQNLRLVQRYWEAEIHLLVRFTVQGLAEEYVASFERALVGRVHEYRQGAIREPLHQIGRSPTHLFEHHVANVHCRDLEGNRNQEAMLIGVVQGREVAEDLASTSLVRLGSVQDLLHSCLRQGHYYTSAPELYRRLGGGPGEWLPKPKGMHQTTWERYQEQLDWLEAEMNAQFMRDVGRWIQ